MTTRRLMRYNADTGELVIYSQFDGRVALYEGVIDGIAEARAMHNRFRDAEVIAFEAAITRASRLINDSLRMDKLLFDLERPTHAPD